ncbi:type VII secretion-associated serine protease mycosin [Nocardia salmonicida]|uniref:Type VII secretion-associated serine protease mycosin n=1 Tax=Nocardia salmonicida TaxID=53431 RepID=A0ABZ1NCS2_9NOCA|nr:type VII secretion-associated serine protease mycosin [Nocardia salmonicida]
MSRSNFGRRVLRLACATTVLGAALNLGGPAVAVAPPQIDPGALGAALALSGRPAPLEPTEPSALCSEPLLTGSPPSEPPISQHVLDLPSAWKFSRGAGQKVAVIDTGVQRHPRLPGLEAGGDYVSGSDGTEDCDGHGTLVAGIIGATPSQDDAFVGVAPEAQILSIRQLSLTFEAVNKQGGQAPGEISNDGYGSVLTLAAAVVRAVEMGATVINISEVACSTAGAGSADASLGAAVKFAYERNVVVVAAAGNVQTDGACKEQNKIPGWSSVSTIASPAWFTPYVLTVGSVDADGKASELSLRGPWVSVAAIGRDIVSLDSKPGGVGLIDGVQTNEGVRPIEGTSFAAPYVAGLAALVRSRFPELNAQQVMDRITRTAHAPGNGRDDGIGHGLIDPLAALTAQLPDQPIARGADVPHPVAAPVLPPGPDPRARRIAVIGATVALGGLAIGLGLAYPFRRKRAALDLDLD